MSIDQMRAAARRRSAAIAGLLLVLAPSVAFAAVTSTDNAHAHNANCSIVASPFVLSYDPLAKNATERVASVTVRCQAEGPLHLSVEADGGSSRSALGRAMTARSSVGSIAYALYVEGQPFGDGTAGTHRFERDYASTSGMITATFLVTLVAPAGQDAPADAYGDRIGFIARY